MPIDDFEQMSRNALAERMIADQLRIQFLNLIAGFAVTDRAAARAMLRTIEADVARGLTQYRDEFIQGPGADDVLVEVMRRLRETLFEARERIAQATHPH